MVEAPAGAVWTKTCQVLKRELGEATFGSWLGQAALRETGDALENVVPQDTWPLPTYREMLFVK